MSTNANGTELATIEQPQESSVGFKLNPKNIDEALKICNYLASSSLVPKQYQGKPQDILVAINWGQEVGLKPLQALNNIAVINGRPSMWGEAPLALVRNHPEFEFILEDNEAFAYALDNVKGWEHLKSKNPDDTSICVVKRKGEPPVVREFSKEDVKTAKLGNVHNQYPKDMRKKRARSRALNDSFGDVLKGVSQAELVQEDQQMIEEGHYDEVNTRSGEESESVKDQVMNSINPGNQQQAKDDQSDDEVADAETLKKIADNAHLAGEEREAELKQRCANKDITAGEARQILSELRKAYKAQQSNSQPNQPGPSDDMLNKVNELGKKLHGSKWYKKSKTMADNVSDGEAENLLGLSDDQMKQLQKTLEHQLEAKSDD